MESRARAFTLIELLVVITILVVLLALLMPAMDQAIYQAELTVCAARIHGVSQSVVAYASSYNRRYPQHRAASTGDAVPNNISGALSPTNSAKMDMRPVLKQFLSLNGHLNCPLSEEVDVEGSGVDTSVTVSYGLWFGWQYRSASHTGKPMNKLGGRFTWNEDEFDVLAGDDDVFNDGDDAGHGSHPDAAGLWASIKYQDDTGPWGAAPLVTLSWWEGTAGRGLVDLNYGFQDGSVRLHEAVEAKDDPSLVTVPARNNNNPPTIHRRLPRR